VSSRICSHPICVAYEYGESEGLEHNQVIPDEISNCGAQGGLSDDEDIDDDSSDEGSDGDERDFDGGEMRGGWNSDDEASW
jgi:hypothetical protein